MQYKQIIVPRFGGSDGLQVAESELLEPERGEVRVKILREATPDHC